MITNYEEQITDYRYADEVGQKASWTSPDGTKYTMEGVDVEGETRPVWWYYYEGFPEYPISDPLSLPYYKTDRWTIEVEQAERLYDEGKVSIDFKFTNNFYYLGKNKDINSEIKKFDFRIDDQIKMYVNDKQVDEQFVYTEKYGEEFTYNYTTDFDATKEDFTVSFIAVTSDSVTGDGFEEGDDNKEFRKDFQFDTSNQTEHDFYLSEADETEFINPIGYDNGKYINESFKFRRIARDEYLFPETTKDLFYFTYTKAGVPTNLGIEMSKEAKLIDFEHINDSAIGIELTNTEPGNYKVSVIEKMYYNEVTKEVNEGTSANFITEQGLVLPWDYYDNQGTLSLELNMQTYQKHQFSIKMNLGNMFRLRGEGGRFNFEDLTNYE